MPSPVNRGGMSSLSPGAMPDPLMLPVPLVVWVADAGVATAYADRSTGGGATCAVDPGGAAADCSPSMAPFAIALTASLEA